MALDTFVNLAYSTLASGITSGATTLTVASGDGAKFSVGGNATIWDSGVAASPDLVAAGSAPEIVRITGISGDVLTISRGQETTSAVAHNTGGHTYSIIQGVTALTLNKLFDKTGDTMTGPMRANAGFAVGGTPTVKTSAYTITSADFLVRFDPSGGAFAITLPAASAGKQYIILAGKGTVNNMTLTCAGSDTMETSPTATAATLAIAFNAIKTFVSDGVSLWVRIG